jgi:hypothetical protein
MSATGRRESSRRGETPPLTVILDKVGGCSVARAICAPQHGGGGNDDDDGVGDWDDDDDVDNDDDDDDDFDVVVDNYFDGVGVCLHPPQGAAGRTRGRHE